MAARRRDLSRRNWPANLYQNGEGYYWFRHPGTGNSFGLGRDFKAASLQVKIFNADLALKKTKPTLMERIQGGGHTVSAFIDEYMAPVREKHAGTRYLVNVEYEVAGIVSAIGDKLVAMVEPIDIVEMVKASATRGTSIPGKLRARARAVFRAAINQGLVTPGQNPVDSTFTPKSKVTRERLSFELFQAIRAEAAKDLDLRWFVNAMNMALITGQRIGDVNNMTKGSIRDGYIWIEQQKTGVRLKIPLTLHLPQVSMTPEEVIRQCNDRVLSKYLFHFVRSYNRSKIGDQPSVSAYSNAFRKMLVRLKYEPAEGKTHTAFHEIRSLSTRMYTEAYGKDFAQILMGHKTSTMTDRYRDSRGSEWQEIKIAG